MATLGNFLIGWGLGIDVVLLNVAPRILPAEHACLIRDELCPWIAGEPIDSRAARQFMLCNLAFGILRAGGGIYVKQRGAFTLAMLSFLAEAIAVRGEVGRDESLRKKAKPAMGLLLGTFLVMLWKRF